MWGCSLCSPSLPSDLRSPFLFFFFLSTLRSPCIFFLHISICPPLLLSTPKQLEGIQKESRGFLQHTRYRERVHRPTPRPLRRYEHESGHLAERVRHIPDISGRITGLSGSHRCNRIHRAGIPLDTIDTRQ